MELDPTMVVFAGEYDAGGKSSLRSLLERVADIPELILDFREVAFIDSTCVTEMLRMHALRVTNGLSRETIVLGETPIRRLFEMLDLYRVFNVVDDVADVPHDIAALKRVEFLFSNSVRR